MTRTGALSPISWGRQALEGFESTPLDQLADRYDLLVIDHPHVADAVSAGVLIPLDDVVPLDRLVQWSSLSAGQSFGSYQYQNRQWAVPVDAATQVSAAQAGTPVLDGWSDVYEFAATERVALCVAGPHAFLTWVSLLVSVGADPAPAAGPFIDETEGVEALEFLRSLFSRTDQTYSAHNPIRLLQRMTEDQTLALCPLIYGYVNYTRTHPGLVFRDAPSWRRGGRRGSVLGGTGVAVTMRARHRLPEISEHLIRLLRTDIQETIVPESGGQPVTIAAWHSPGVNAASGDFYLNTIHTLEDAWVRPRRVGWPAFQDAASATIRDVLTGGLRIDRAVAHINNSYEHSNTPKA